MNIKHRAAAPKFNFGKLVMAFPLLIFLAVLLFFVIAGVRLAWSNGAKLRTFEVMPVTVVEKRAIEHIRRGGPNNRQRIVEYQPMVIYRYEVGGRQYESHRVWPERILVGEEWARDVLEQFKVGSVYQGYHDPHNPSDAFLLREYNPSPLIVSGFASMILLAISAMFVRSLWSR